MDEPSQFCSKLSAELLKSEFPWAFRGYSAELRFRDGWLGIVQLACRRIAVLCAGLPDDRYPILDTCKEKFGELRLSFSLIKDDGHCVHTQEEYWTICEKAMEQSRVTCEVCAGPGQLRKLGWMRCLCDEHSEGGEPTKSFYELPEEATAFLQKYLDKRKE